MKLKLICIALFLLFVSVISGCATLGPVYQKADKIPPDVGVIYTYRTFNIVGSAVTTKLYTNKGQTYLARIQTGGYFPFYAKPGEVDLSAATEAESSITLDVKAGQVYFVKLHIGMGFIVGRPYLTIVDNDLGEKEIADCKLIPKAE